MQSRAPRAVAALAILLGLLLGTASGGAGLGAPPQTFRALADDAAVTLTQRFYASDGRWRACLDPSCGAGNVDWGSDSLTGVLYARWLVTHDAALEPIFRELERTEPRYGDCRRPRCKNWSDVPMWDAVAALRTYDVTHDDVALRNAEAAYRAVAASDAYARGACPALDYQRPKAESGGLKTLETDANRTLAAVLLAQRTRRPEYLAAAAAQYADVRAWFYNPQLELYTVYVFDDGRACRALPHRFFASVNGVMIDAGLELARATHDERYAHEARATAHAIRALDDDRGVFADLQAENRHAGRTVLRARARARVRRRARNRRPHRHLAKQVERGPPAARQRLVRVAVAVERRARVAVRSRCAEREGGWPVSRRARDRRGAVAQRRPLEEEGCSPAIPRQGDARARLAAQGERSG